MSSILRYAVDGFKRFKYNSIGSAYQLFQVTKLIIFIVKFSGLGIINVSIIYHNDHVTIKYHNIS